MFVTIVRTLLVIYELILFARILSTWFPAPYGGPMRRLYDILYDLTEPVLRPLRSMLPPLRMGVVGLDLSPIIVFIVIGILLRVIR